MVDFIKIFEIFNIVFLGGWTKDQIKIKIKILTAIKEELLRQKKIVKALCDWLETFPQPNPLKEYLKKKLAILEALCKIIDQLLVKCKCKLKALCLLDDIKNKEKQITDLTENFNNIVQAIFSNGKIDYNIMNLIHYQFNSVPRRI